MKPKMDGVVPCESCIELARRHLIYDPRQMIDKITINTLQLIEIHRTIFLLFECKFVYVNCCVTKLHKWYENKMDYLLNLLMQ